MTGSAKGTAEKPDRRLKKAELNRAILAAAPGMFLSQLRIKVRRSLVRSGSRRSSQARAGADLSRLGRGPDAARSERTHALPNKHVISRDRALA